MKRTKSSPEELVVETARRLLTKGIGNRGMKKNPTNLDLNSWG